MPHFRRVDIPPNFPGVECIDTRRPIFLCDRSIFLCGHPILLGCLPVFPRSPNHWIRVLIKIARLFSKLRANVDNPDQILGKFKTFRSSRNQFLANYLSEFALNLIKSAKNFPKFAEIWKNLSSRRRNTFKHLPNTFSSKFRQKSPKYSKMVAFASNLKQISNRFRKRSPRNLLKIRYPDNLECLDYPKLDRFWPEQLPRNTDNAPIKVKRILATFWVVPNFLKFWTNPNRELPRNSLKI